MGESREVEIKFRVKSVSALEGSLAAAGFQQITPPTHELNTLFDLPDGTLRRRGEVLRIRKYGETWLLTHKSKGAEGRHKIRIENETTVADGQKLKAILTALGYLPSFTYEKFRSEWSDGTGHVVIDQTPIGNLAEIEGAPDWIDATAQKLGVQPAEYITANYAQLFDDWRKSAHSKAQNMTFAELNVAPPY